MTQDMADAHGRVATGFGIGGRKLYSDADEFSFYLKQPQIFTSIDRSTKYPDFADRLIYVTPQTISARERKTEAEIGELVVPVLPRILGTLLEVVVGTLANPHAKPDELLRMADFAQWIHCAIPAFGWHPDKLAEAYNANLAEASIEIAESDVVAPAITALMEMVAAGKTPSSGWVTADGNGRAARTSCSRRCRSMRPLASAAGSQAATP